MIHGQKGTKSQLIRQSVTKCSNLGLLAKMMGSGVSLQKHLSYLRIGEQRAQKVFLKIKVSRNVAILGNLKISNMLRPLVKCHTFFTVTS